MAHTPRRWALAHPEQYALVFGSPVPGCAAPVDRTTPAPQRSSTPSTPPATSTGTGTGRRWRTPSWPTPSAAAPG
ncbi:MAG: TetR-like C-terminal domain-containing protein [Tetrasphaera sp.]